MFTMTVSRKDFGRFSMSGGRFETAEGLPIQVLKEVSAYERLIQRVAADLYRRDNPKKKRVPRNFSRSLDMRLTSITHGCVVLGLDTAVPDSSQLTFDGNDEPDYFDKARTLVKDTVKKAKEDQNFKDLPGFPSLCLPDLLNFGKSLDNDEKISLSEIDESDRVDLDEEWRQLARASDSESKYSDISLTGQIIGLTSMDDGGATYKFKSYEPKETLAGKIGSDLWEKFKDFLGQSNRAPMAAISVVICSDPDTGIRSIEQTYSISEALPRELLERVKEISQLSQGWLDPNTGEGEPPSDIVLDVLEPILSVIVESDLSVPLIAPSPNGGVEIEWEDNDFEIAISPNHYITAFNLAEDRNNDGQKEFSFEENFESIISWLKNGDAQSDVA